jgi:O-antigen ligase
LLPRSAPVLCALVPLCCSPLFRDGYAVPQAAAAAVASLACFFLLRRPDAGSPRSRLDAPALALLAAAGLSAAFSLDRPLSLFGGYPDPVFSLAGLSLGVVALALGGGIAAGGLAPALRRGFVWVSVPVSLYALLQRAGLELWMPLDGLPTGGRPVSTLGSPLFLGAYLAMVLPLALETAREEGSRRVAARAALVPLLAALAATLARSAWLGAAAGALLWGALRGEGGVRRRPLALAALALLLAGGAAVSVLRPGVRAEDRWRTEAWSIAGRAFMESPVLGTGPDAFGIPYRALRGGSGALSASVGQTQAHDDLLQILATMGLLGFLAYLWLQLRLGARLLDAAGDGEAAAAGAAALAVWTAAKFTAASFSTVWPAALFAGVCAGAPGEEGPFRRRMTAGLLTAALLFGGFAALRAASADRQARRGRLARRAGLPREAAVRFERAIARRPEATVYRFELVNLLRDAADAVPAHARVELAGRARETAEEGARLRPLDADAQRLLGEAELFCARSGDVPAFARARLAFERAVELDPLYPGSHLGLAAAARALGDRAGEARELAVSAAIGAR